MPEDIEAILTQVEAELGEDARAALARVLDGVDDGAGADRSEGTLPDDVDRAKEGEMSSKADGAGSSGDGVSSPDDPVSEAELEERLADIRSEIVTQDDLAEVAENIEGVTQEALAEALPGLVEDVGQKMASGRSYTDGISETFAPSTTSGPGRNPLAGEGGRTRQKMEAGAGGSEAEGTDYTEEIASAFGTDE